MFRVTRKYVMFSVNILSEKCLRATKAKYNGFYMTNYGNSLHTDYENIAYIYNDIECLYMQSIAS